MDMPYNRIACCVDRDEMTDEVLAEGMRLAGGDARALQVVHVAPAPLIFDTADGAVVVSPRDVNAVERSWLEALARDTPGSEAVFLEGLAGPEICRWAESAGADLLVATRHHGGWGAAILGSVTRHLVDHAPCPVLVVRPDGAVQEIPRPTTSEPRA